MRPVRARLERIGFHLLYRLVDLTYALGVATPKRSAAGTYWSYEPTNPHGDDPGLAALAALPTDATVVDVGAHVGEHAIPLARGTDRDVIAFEPNGESADRLVRNARRNGLRVSDPSSERVDAHDADAIGTIDLRRAGLGDADATLSFYRSTFSKLSAFDRDRATRWGAEVAGIEAVPIRRLDDLVDGIDPEGDSDAVPSPDAIKIDVEGREGAVLRGAEQTVEAYRPLVVVEVHGEGNDAALREWFTERGYAVEESGDIWICRG